jgi:hypothetical protein
MTAPTTAREFADELFGSQDDWCGGEACCRCGPAVKAIAERDAAIRESESASLRARLAEAEATCRALERMRGEEVQRANNKGAENLTRALGNLTRMEQERDAARSDLYETRSALAQAREELAALREAARRIDELSRGQLNDAHSRVSFQFCAGLLHDALPGAIESAPNPPAAPSAAKGEAPRSACDWCATRGYTKPCTGCAAQSAHRADSGGES